MGVIQKFLGSSPFGLMLEHTRKVHACVELVRPIAEALIAGDWEQIEKLHHEMSSREHQADEVKTVIRDQLGKVYMLSVGRYEVMRFLTYQDNVADAAEDFAVVALLRKTVIPPELHGDLRAFVEQVVIVSEHLLALAEELSVLAESAFTGREAKRIVDGAAEIGEQEWMADKLQRRFARHYYGIEDKLDPITILFLDKYCATLSKVANSAEKTAKYMRQMIGGL